MKNMHWLFPGIYFKRWFAALIAGIMLTGLGAALLFLDLFGRDFNTTWLGILMAILGVLVIVISINNMLRSYVHATVPVYMHGQMKNLYQRQFLKKGPRIVVIGGGTGLSVLLRGLKEYTSNITAIVSVTDDGGSSGRLRGEFGILPPGDLRNCLVALADTEPAMESLFNYRFSKGQMAGHNLGNLLITAMAELSGSFETAIDEASKVLAIRGRVLPSTLGNIVLAAELQDNTIIKGESNISHVEKPIKRVFIIPQNPQPLQEAVEAILEAEVIVLGPGSLYTSLIPNLLVPGIVEAIQKSKAIKMYVCNIMTQPGETQNYTAGDHLRTIYAHSAENLVRYVIVNNEKIPPEALEKYNLEGAEAVKIDMDNLEKMNATVLTAQLFQEQGYIRHHSHKLAYLIMKQIYPKNSVQKILKLLRRR